MTLYEAEASYSGSIPVTVRARIDVDENAKEALREAFVLAAEKRGIVDIEPRGVAVSNIRRAT